MSIFANSNYSFQACDSSENLSGEPYDPYAHIRCNICNGMEDDSLMLLCDVCDSASHTYCVGLGTTVPEGDWFCRFCDINGRNASAWSQTGLDGDDRILATSVETHPSIRDTVREPNNLRLGTVIGRVPSCPNNKATALVTLDRSNVSNESRTLHSCRNIHTHIRALRENWHDLRRGSLSFRSSSLTDCSNQKKLEVDPSTSTSCQNAESSNEERSLGDVEKAWKMMKIAKAICKSTSHVNPTLETPGRQTNPKNACSTTSNASVVGNQQYKRRDLVRTAVRNQGHWSWVNDELKHQSVVKDEHNRCLVARKENSESNKGNPPRSSCSSENKDHRENGTGSSRNSKLNVHDGNCRSGKDDINIEGTNIPDAKSEIQSLVKINLKLLSRDKRLGVDTFKKAARLATHTILAACGLEPWKLNSYSLPNSICNHEKDIQQRLRKVSLMPNCCVECFYVVVQDIVKTAMEETSKGNKH